ncbi:alcohol dehydrogenase transcription factor myb/SANT-like domain-containing protein [Ditylenchus destructor]|uniref:Alcohol dehydrogenase transcription factor myb/SANT-like domain-containing protein n=1 Tax=Ditylenchus destructor TaxID=166010 RepID=A0AAD4MWT2_9BILA|nr:alcohol dehydrogenase transcription factor myb/SANT-like domain-containing protein [Ditylenchus destructor]
MEDRNYEYLDTKRGGQMVKDANGYLYWKSAEKRNTNGETRVYWRCMYFQKGPNGEKDTACKGFGLLYNNVFRVTTNHSHEPCEDAVALKEFEGRVRHMAKSNTEISARTVIERALNQQKDETPNYVLGDIKDDVVERNIRRYRKNCFEEPMPESLDELIMQNPYFGHHNETTSEMGNYQKDVRLMEAVRKYPQLYDKNHPEYRDQVRKGPIWDRIAQEVGFEDTKSAQGRWHSIRAAYQASNKRSQTRNGGEAASSYVYAKELAFLNWGPEERQGNDSWLSLIGTENSADPSYEDYDEKPSSQNVNGTVEFSSVNPVDPALLSVFDPKPRSDDEWHQFGSHVGSFLARLPDNRKKRELCIKIEQLMLEFEPDS